ncbi:MAG: CsgG/HfaB family protein [Gemmatimonas sp.]
MRFRSSIANPRLRHAAGGWLLTAALASACAPPIAVKNARTTSAETLARQNIAQEASLSFANIPENSLSVAPLTVQSADTSYSALGFGMAALLVTDLSRSPGLVLVERQRLDAVVRELKLAETRRVDTLTAPRVGKLIGARRLVVGNIDIRPNKEVFIDSYIANTQTGRVASSLRGNATLAQFFDAEKSLVFRMFDALKITLTPAQRRAIEPRPTRSLAAFLAFSKGARAEAFGDLPSAAAFYALALRIDPDFALAGRGLASLQGITFTTAYFPTFVTRAAGITSNLVNRPAGVLIGSGVDLPISSAQQLVTFTITVRTP